MSRRERIRMTAEEVAAFLDTPQTMSVATLGRTGHPHLVAMWYAFVDGPGFADGRLAFWTYGKSQKAVNLRRDPRITCLVEDGERYEELRGVELVGTGRVVEDDDEVLEVGEAVLRRYGNLEVTDAIRDDLRRQAAKRVAVFVEVEDVTSWDHRKLGGTY